MSAETPGRGEESAEKPWDAPKGSAEVLRGPTSASAFTCSFFGCNSETASDITGGHETPPDYHRAVAAHVDGPRRGRAPRRRRGRGRRGEPAAGRGGGEAADREVAAAQGVRRRP